MTYKPNQQFVTGRITEFRWAHNTLLRALQRVCKALFPLLFSYAQVASRTNFDLDTSQFHTMKLCIT